jgi:ApaG protein
MKRETGIELGDVAPAQGAGGGQMFQRTTRQIKVSVEPAYLADQSAPDSNHFFWAYTVLIENGGLDTVQLRARYWRIIDANGRTIEVKGAGVVGQQPILRPGEKFEYKSGTPLETPSGMMPDSLNPQCNVDMPSREIGWVNPAIARISRPTLLKS